MNAFDQHIREVVRDLFPHRNSSNPVERRQVREKLNSYFFYRALRRRILNGGFANSKED